MLGGSRRRHEGRSKIKTNAAASHSTLCLGGWGEAQRNPAGEKRELKIVGGMMAFRLYDTVSTVGGALSVAIHVKLVKLVVKLVAKLVGRNVKLVKLVN